MVDRIEKVDPSLYRVQETDKDRGRRDQGEEEEERKKREKDKFDRGRPFWKKLIPDTAPKTGAQRWGGTPTISPGGPGIRSPETDEPSLSLSQRLLVVWGILDLTGRPRVPVIVTYAVIVTVMAISSFLILGILWR